VRHADERGKRGRSGLTRFELAVTVFMVVLAVAGIASLVPLTADRSSAVSTPVASTSRPIQLNDAELAGPRAEAALAPCPQPPPGGVAPPPPPVLVPAAFTAPATPVEAGPLAGIEVPCLGAPGTVRPAAALYGRETLLNVWASWCVPCKEELPALAAYAARPDAIPVVGVNVKDNPVKALKLLAQLNIHLPMLVDSGDAITGKLRTIALPASFLMRPDGSVQQLMPQVAYTEAFEVADAVAVARTAGK
jgi:thiol-disulfide isomerase/thioredoxin